MRTFRSALFAALLILSGSASWLFSFPSMAAAASADVIESNASYHARRTFGTGLYDPVSDKTYITYSGPVMDVYVKAFDHAANAWEPAVKIRTWNDSVTSAYHDYTTMVMLPDGKLGIFIFNHSTSAYLLKAPTANSISGTWTLTPISGDKTAYPMPIVVGGDVYLFYSKNDDSSYPYRTYRYIKSSDSGQTWSAPSTIIDTGKTADKFNEVYAFGVYQKFGNIYITWTMGGGPGGHNAEARNLYLAYLDTSDSTMRNAAGVNLKSTVNFGADLDSCLVATSLPTATGTEYFANHPIQNSQPSVDDDGTIYVGYGDESVDGPSIKLAKFSGGAWSFSTVDATTSRFLDMVKTGSHRFEVLYASEDFSTLHGKQTDNGGTSWYAKYTYNTPFGGSNADRVFYANFIEGRSAISAVGATINYAERQLDYTGKWTVFAITR